MQHRPYDVEAHRRRCLHVSVMRGAQCNTDHMMLRLTEHVSVMCGVQCNTDHMMLRLTEGDVCMSRVELNATPTI